MALEIIIIIIIIMLETEGNQIIQGAVRRNWSSCFQNYIE